MTTLIENAHSNRFRRFAGSRAGAVVDVLLVFAVFAVCGAWPVPDTNEAHYLTKAKHFWEPSWIENDIFLSSTDSHVAFYATFGWLTHALALPTAAWVGRAIAWLMLAVGWRHLSYALAPRFGWAALTGAAAVAICEHFHLAGEWFVGGIEAKVPAYALVFWGLGDVVMGRWNRGLIVLGAASAFHVLVGGWSVAACAAVWIFDKNRPALRTITAGLACGGLLALIGVMPGLQLSSGVDKELAAKANQIYVFERIAHHLWAVDFVPKFALRHVALYILLAVWCRFRPADDELRRLRRFVAAAATFSLIGIVISYASPQPSAWAAGLLKYYWFRLSDVALALGVTFETASVGQGASEARALWRRLALTSLLAFGAVHIGYITWQRVETRGLPRGEKIPLLGSYHNWKDVCAWIRDNTPKDALVLAPRPHVTFKWFAERAEFATWKDVPQDARSLVEWRRRHDELYGDLGSWVNYLPAARIRNVVEKYDVDYIVTYVDPPLEFEPVYRNNSFVVYRVAPR